MSLLFVAATGVTVAAIAGLGWWFSEEQVTRRALAQVRATPIARVKEGTLVKIVGRAKPLSAALRAPISARRCVAWSLHVERSARNGWATIHSAQNESSFLVEDASGRARVDVRRARLVLHDDHIRENGGLGANWSEPLVEYCNAHEIETKDFLGLDRNLRCREGVLELGETVAVMGVATFEPVAGASDAGFRESARRLVIVAPDDAPILLSDHDDTKR